MTWGIVFEGALQIISHPVEGREPLLVYEGLKLCTRFPLEGVEEK